MSHEERKATSLPPDVINVRVRSMFGFRAEKPRDGIYRFSGRAFRVCRVDPDDGPIAAQPGHLVPRISVSRLPDPLAHQLERCFPPQVFHYLRIPDTAHRG